MGKTSIEWTRNDDGTEGKTWNPIGGCSVVSPGCANCYAMRMAARIEKMQPDSHYRGLTRRVNGNPVWTGKIARAPDKIFYAPLKWKKPTRVFVNSMSDLFHEAVPDEWIDEIFQTMARTPRHQYMILTKRPVRMLGMYTLWPENVWMGVSVESLGQIERIDLLRTGDAAVKFLSLEPLLGPLPNLNLDGISLCIVGGESGPGRRPVNLDWLRDIRDQCRAAGVPLFVKQIDKVIPIPDDLMIREWPEAKGFEA